MRSSIILSLATLVLCVSAVAQDEKKEVISFSGSGDGPIKTVEKDGSVEETDASTLNNINVIPGFSGPKYSFENEEESRQRQTRNRTQTARNTGGSKQDQAERIDEMLKDRKRHIRRGSSSDRPPKKR